MSIDTETIRAELESLRQTHTRMESQIAALEHLVAPSDLPGSGPVLSTNPHRDPNLRPVGSIASYHLNWEPPGDHASQEVQDRKEQELLDQVRAIRDKAHPNTTPVIMSTDGAPLWAAYVGLTWAEFHNPAYPGLRHYEVWVKPTSRRFTQGARFGSDGVWHLGPETAAVVRGVENRARALSDASPLAPGGLLAVQEKRITWNGTPVVLQGLSPTYGHLHTRAIDGPAMVEYLHGLGLNLWRVWLEAEQWTALAGNPDAALSPWKGRPGAYNLSQHRQEWWDGLEATLGKAHELGFAMMLSFRDWSGFRNLSKRGHWPTHPFNARNNLQDLIDEQIPPRGYPRAITAIDGPVWDVTLAFLVRLRGLLQSYPGVIVEIGNEPRGVDPEAELAWHQAVARVLHEE